MGFGAMRITGDGSGASPKTPTPSAPSSARGRAGVNLIDTADSYGPQVSERLIAERCTRTRRPGRRDKGRLGAPGRRPVGPERPPRPPQAGLRGQPAPAARRPDRPLPAPRGRPERAARGVDRRAQGAPGRGQDPPRRREQRQRAQLDEARGIVDVVSVQNATRSPTAAARTCWTPASGTASPSCPTSRSPPAASRSPAAPLDRDRERARRHARPGGAGLAAPELAEHDPDPGHVVGRAPGGERRGGRARAERGRDGHARRGGGASRRRRRGGAQPRGAGLLARAGVAVQRAALDRAVDQRDQLAVLGVGAIAVTGLHGVLETAEVGLHRRGVAAVLRAAHAPPAGSAFLVTRCWP